MRIWCAIAVLCTMSALGGCYPEDDVPPDWWRSSEALSLGADVGAGWTIHQEDGQIIGDQRGPRLAWFVLGLYLGLLVVVPFTLGNPKRGCAYNAGQFVGAWLQIALFGYFVGDQRITLGEDGMVWETGHYYDLITSQDLLDRSEIERVSSERDCGLATGELNCTFAVVLHTTDHKQVRLFDLRQSTIRTADAATQEQAAAHVAAGVAAVLGLASPGESDH